MLPPNVCTCQYVNAYPTTVCPHLMGNIIETDPPEHNQFLPTKKSRELRRQDQAKTPLSNNASLWLQIRARCEGRMNHDDSYIGWLRRHCHGYTAWGGLNARDATNLNVFHRRGTPSQPITAPTAHPILWPNLQTNQCGADRAAALLTLTRRPAILCVLSRCVLVYR